MNKTLRKVLQETKIKKCNVKIGSAYGSSFWYCGKANLLYSEPILREINKELKSQSKRLHKDFIYRLNNLDSIYENIIIQAKKDIESGEKTIKNFDNYVKALYHKRDKERVSLPKKIASIEEDIETNVFDRKVVEIVYGISPDERPCWIIYVKGNERGSYWTIKEFEDGVAEEDED